MENFQQHNQNQNLDPIPTCRKAELLLDSLVHLKINLFGLFLAHSGNRADIVSYFSG